MVTAAATMSTTPKMMTVAMASNGSSAVANGTATASTAGWSSKGLGLGLGMGVWGFALLGGVSALAVYGYVRSRKTEAEQSSKEQEHAFQVEEALDSGLA